MDHKNPSMSRSIAYKIVPKSVWESQLSSLGKFIGTEVDGKDGFIHLSASEQLKETARKWFRGQRNLLLIRVDLTKIQGVVKWEPSRNNDLFPHVYGSVDSSSVIWIRDLLLTTDGLDFVYPPEVGLDG